MQLIFAYLHIGKDECTSLIIHRRFAKHCMHKLTQHALFMTNLLFELSHALRTPLFFDQASYNLLNRTFYAAISLKRISLCFVFLLNSLIRFDQVCCYLLYYRLRRLFKLLRIEFALLRLILSLSSGLKLAQSDDNIVTLGLLNGKLLSRLLHIVGEFLQLLH